MLKIKFSHSYPKIHGQKNAQLIHVRRLEASNLHEDLIEYDTRTSTGEYYALPKGLLLQLVFMGDKGIPFCTLRRHTPDKEAYYRASVGMMFEVKVVSNIKVAPMKPLNNFI